MFLNNLAPCAILAVASGGLFAQAAPPEAKCAKDSCVTVTSVEEYRRTLIGQIWGESGFPKQKARVSTVDRSQPNWKSVTEEMGIVCPRDFQKLERLEFKSAHAENAGYENQNIGYHFIANGAPKNLVIVHQGHSCKFDAGSGLSGLVRVLLQKGYSVAALYMPHRLDCSEMTSFHHDLFKVFKDSKKDGSALQFFIDPAAQTVKYFENKYSTISMIGLSGGGWTATVYAAVDPTVKLSIPVAGTRPWTLPCGLNDHDTEQAEVLSYLNLYVLGSVAPGRRQIQILNKYDDCCFQVICGCERRDLTKKIKNYEEAVAKADIRLGGGGNFSVNIDETSYRHQISDLAIQTILGALPKH